MDVIVWVDLGAVVGAPPSAEQIDLCFANVDMAIDQGTGAEREECIKESAAQSCTVGQEMASIRLIIALKADLPLDVPHISALGLRKAAIDSGDEAKMEAAVVRAREARSLFYMLFT